MPVWELEEETVDILEIVKTIKRIVKESIKAKILRIQWGKICQNVITQN